MGYLLIDIEHSASLHFIKTEQLLIIYERFKSSPPELVYDNGKDIAFLSNIPSF